jgi:chromosome segregation ATPase
MRRKVLAWQRSLDAFDDIIQRRRDYYEPRLPEIDSQFRKLDAQMRVRLAQRERLDDRLKKMLVAPAPELLATSSEHEARAALEKLAARLEERGEGPGVASARARLKRLEGALLWQIETRYHERLTEAHDHLRELNADVEMLQRQYDAFVRVRQAASHSYSGYTDQIEELRGRVRRSLSSLERLRKREGRMLETVASRELLRRRERLAAYQNKARFAFADSYDRAAKNPVRKDP